MNINVLEQEKNRYVFEIIGADHTTFLALQHALDTNKDVHVATYAIDHPLIGNPKFIIQTTSGDAKTALLDAIDTVDAELDKLHKDLAKQFA